jgi:hypothetical protein
MLGKSHNLFGKCWANANEMATFLQFIQIKAYLSEDIALPLSLNVTEHMPNWNIWQLIRVAAPAEQRN